MENKDFALKNDSLTGLPLLIIHQKNTLKFIQEKFVNTQISLIYGDIDNLKNFQDYNSLPVGDRLIQAVANSINSLLPENGTAYRIGGDEFLIILPNYSLKQTRELAELIREDVEKITLDVNGEWIAKSPGITLGLAVSYGINWDIITLLRQADEANIKGKNEGKNKVCYSIS
jgi:diguanylate cyclase (GGDEF)-like protein